MPASAKAAGFDGGVVIPLGAPVVSGVGQEEWGKLMAAAQAGNGAAYRSLLEELRDWLVRFYARRLPSAHVDDAVQDALIAIHEKRHTYDPARSFKPWLAAVARYKWIDRLRSMGRHAGDELSEDLAVPDDERAVTSAVAFDKLISYLKPAQRDAIRLVKIQGFSVEEAASRTGQSASLIKVNIHRGLARLAAILEGQAHDE